MQRPQSNYVGKQGIVGELLHLAVLAKAMAVADGSCVCDFAFCELGGVVHILDEGGPAKYG